jgi:hypothetical protein
MTTIRRIYWHLAAFVGLLLAVIGLVVLIGLIVDRGFDAFRDFMIGSSAPALALTSSAARPGASAGAIASVKQSLR